ASAVGRTARATARRHQEPPGSMSNLPRLATPPGSNGTPDSPAARPALDGQGTISPAHCGETPPCCGAAGHCRSRDSVALHARAGSERTRSAQAVAGFRLGRVTVGVRAGLVVVAPQACLSDRPL